MSGFENPINYRPADLEDASGIVLLTAQAEAALKSWEPQLPIQREDVKKMEGSLGQSATWSRLAFEGDRLVGHAIGYPLLNHHYPEESSVQHGAYLMVHPLYWRKGIGGNLLDWSVQQLPRIGSTAINLWVDKDNQPAQRLYASRDFQFTGKYRLHPKTYNPQIEFLYKL